MVESTRKGYQPGTAKNLRTYINRYLDFCLEYNLSQVPANGKQLCRFVQFLADSPTISAIETINNYLGGVKTFHRLLNLPPPDTSEFLFNLTIRGLKLTLVRPIHQVEPMTPEIIQKMFAHVDLNYEEQLVAWVALMVGFHLLLCKSNLVPDTQASYDSSKQLVHRNLCLVKNVILVEIEWCKTLQFKEKKLILPLVQLKTGYYVQFFGFGL